MKAIYLNVNEDKKPEIVDIEDDLKTYYKLIQCDSIDIVTRNIRKSHIALFAMMKDCSSLLQKYPQSMITTNHSLSAILLYAVCLTMKAN